MIYEILFSVDKVQQRSKSARDAKIRSIAARQKLKSGSGRKNLFVFGLTFVAFLFPGHLGKITI